jgi:hypothetical protein
VLEILFVAASLVNTPSRLTVAGRTGEQGLQFAKKERSLLSSRIHRLTVMSVSSWASFPGRRGASGRGSPRGRGAMLQRDGPDPVQRNDGGRRSVLCGSARSAQQLSNRGKILRRSYVNRAAARTARRLDAADLRRLVVDRPQPNEAFPGLKVLHVVEALGSGIATALEDYLRSTPGHAHTILGYRRPSAQTGDELERLATRLLLLPEGRLAQIRTVRRWVRELGPDVIHAHSTFAGLYVRLFVRAPAATLIYTPHAYPFERRDIPAALRGLYWLIEALLSLRGGCVAAVGPREAELAERLPGKQVVVQLPNVVRSVRPALPASVQDRSAEGELRLAMLGRISPQKGPDFFRRAVELSQALALPLRWIWVGGGEPADEQALRRAGAEVTGWL